MRWRAGSSARALANMDLSSPESLVVAFGEAASILGFAFVPKFSVSFASGTTVQALGLVRDFGSPSGTLLFSIGSEPAPDNLKAIRDAGYYYSVLNAESYGRYVERDFVDTLNDWGYYGAPSATPKWYSGKPWS
jgi:hypothetical protein